jgi:hypothetical protein
MARVSTKNPPGALSPTGSTEEVKTGGSRHSQHATRKRKAQAASIELTKFTKVGGPLTKIISLVKGAVVSDGSACVMVCGSAERVKIATVAELGALIERLRPSQAIALGTLRADLPHKVDVAPKGELVNGAGQPHIIARTGDNITYQGSAFALLDYDTKGMPPGVAAELKRLGGFWSALLTVLPALGDVARVTRRSTSAGLYRSDTGKALRGSDEVHVYVQVKDGGDIERFLRTLHARCWLAGLGWMVLGADGALLERSIVDRMVGGPERLVFEGGPILTKPLKQDKASRRPISVDGGALDTVAACPPLSIVENSTLQELKARERQRLAPESAKARAAFIDRQAKSLAKRTGKPEQAARKVIERQCEGVLHPDVVLPFDDEDLAGKTVGDVLADPARFEGETLADPIEGVAYGRCKAKVMRRSDGTPWIHSFAHGRTIYQLKLDAAGVRKAMEAAAKDDVVKTYVRLAVGADLDPEELGELRQLAKKLSGVGLSVIDSILKAAQEKYAAQQARENRKQRLAARRDPRPMIDEPMSDAPWLPLMGALNDVIKSSATMRDIDGVVTRGSKLRVPNTHAFTQSDANAEENENEQAAAA